MLSLSRRFVLVAAVFAPGAQAWPRDAEEEAVRAVLLRRFDRPEARLTVEPVTIQDALAVAGWSQGAMGGRANMNGANTIGRANDSIEAGRCGDHRQAMRRRQHDLQQQDQVEPRDRSAEPARHDSQYVSGAAGIDKPAAPP